MANSGPEKDLDLIGPEEAGLILGVHGTTVTRWADRGKLDPFIKLPLTGGYRFERRVILEKLEEFKRAAMPKGDGDAA